MGGDTAVLGEGAAGECYLGLAWQGQGAGTPCQAETQSWMWPLPSTAYPPKPRAAAPLGWSGLGKVLGIVPGKVPVGDAGAVRVPCVCGILHKELQVLGRKCSCPGQTVLALLKPRQALGAESVCVAAWAGGWCGHGVEAFLWHGGEASCRPPATCTEG